MGRFTGFGEVIAVKLKLIIPVLFIVILAVFAYADGPENSALTGKDDGSTVLPTPTITDATGKEADTARQAVTAAATVKEKVANARETDSIRKIVTTAAAKPLPALTRAASALTPAAVALKQNECIDDSLNEELNKLMAEFKEAAQGNDTESMTRLRTKMQEMKQQLSEGKRECLKNRGKDVNLGRLVSAAVKEKNGSAKEIVAYYKTKLSEELSEEQDTPSQIERLKELRSEIDSMISDLISSQERINASELKELVKEIKVNRQEIIADKLRIAAKNKAFAIKLNNVAAEIKSTDEGATLDSDGVSAVADELSFDGSKIKVGNSEVKMLPAQLAEKLRIQAKEMQLVEENNRSVYRVKVAEKRKILGLFAVNMQKQLNADGTDGSLISEEKPWWAFVTTGAGTKKD